MVFTNEESQLSMLICPLYEENRRGEIDTFCPASVVN